MSTTKLRGFTLFILLCGLVAVFSLPVAAEQGIFKVTLVGFKVNRQTNEGLRAMDGADDEVRFLSFVGKLDAAGSYSFGRNTMPLSVMRGIRASQRGEIQPISPAITFYNEEIGQNTQAALIIPSIWEWDDLGNLRLFSDYTAGIESSSRSVLPRELATIVRNRPSTMALSKFLLSGNALGISFNSMEKLAGGIPQDRPIGMHPTGINQFGFMPQGLILTFDSANFMAQTDFDFGRGVVPVRYVDASGMGGDYTLLFKVERTDSGASACPADMTSTFSGTSKIVVTIPGQAPLVFTPSISLPVEFTNCRTRLRIINFPPITTIEYNTPLGRNQTTISLTGGGTGVFDLRGGNVRLPIDLSFVHRLNIGNSTMSLNLTGVESGGNLTLSGEAPFSGGFLGSTGSRMSVRIMGSFSPRPR